MSATPATARAQRKPTATVHYDTATKTYSLVEDNSSRPYHSDNGRTYTDYWTAQLRANWLNWNDAEKQKNVHHSPEEQRRAEQAARTQALAALARTLPSNLATPAKGPKA